MKFLSSIPFPSGDTQAIREFLAYLPSVRGDLSTISAPTPLLAPKSIVEYPASVALHHSLFLLPATQESPLDRAVSIFKNYICTLNAQAEGCHTNTSDTNGGASGSLKKPLNPFLGELFLARIRGGGPVESETEIVCEQVSHHPPTTASYLSNKKAGISVQAHLTQLTNFTPTTGGITITQNGHALTQIDNYDEHHLATFPMIRVRGLFSFGGSSRYTEYSGECHIVSSSGLITRILFEEEVAKQNILKQKFGWSAQPDHKVNGLRGRISGTISRWRESTDGNIEKEEQPLVKISGAWNGDIVIMDVSSGEKDIFSIEKVSRGDILTSPVEKQSQWETQRAWALTKEALIQSDWKRAAEEKRRIEEWQRDLRRSEGKEGGKWKPHYFGIIDRCARFGRLSKAIGVDSGRTLGSDIWRYKTDEVEKNHER